MQWDAFLAQVIAGEQHICVLPGTPRYRPLRILAPPWSKAVKRSRRAPCSSMASISDSMMWLA